MKNKLNLVTALFVMLLWGSLFIFVKIGYQNFDISTKGEIGLKTVGDLLLFAGVRFSICGAIITLYRVFTKKESFKPVKSNLPLVLLSGTFSVILHYSFTYLGLALTDGGKTAIIKQIGAVLYIAMSPLFFKDDKITAEKIIGAVLGVAGIVMINFKGGEINFYIGDLFVLLASFCVVGFNVTGKKVYENVEPVTTTGISQLFGGVVLLSAGLALGGTLRPTGVKAYFVLAYICIASILSYALWSIVLKKEQLSKMFIIKFSEPVFASIFGWILLGENILKWQYGVAFALIVGGITIANLKKKA